MFGLGLGEILVILIFAIIFIGPKKLPGLMKKVGQSLKTVQQTKNEIIGKIQITSDIQKKSDYQTKNLDQYSDS